MAVTPKESARLNCPPEASRGLAGGFLVDIVGHYAIRNGLVTNYCLKSVSVSLEITQFYIFSADSCLCQFPLLSVSDIENLFCHVRSFCTVSV